jgi:hypothetical protein
VLPRCRLKLQLQETAAAQRRTAQAEQSALQRAEEAQLHINALKVRCCRDASRPPVFRRLLLRPATTVPRKQHV